MRILVTGGSGFLGAEVCRRLVARGHAVRSLQRGHRVLPPHGAEAVLGDLRDTAAVADAVRGCDAVVHTAALADVWGPRRDFEAVNIAGTAAVLDACRQHGVTRLVHCSSASVVFAGKDLEGVDESAPYPRRFLAPYPWSKARAEQLVLAANSPRLATVSLRPHLIWGDGDPHLLPGLRAAVRRGRLPLPGTGANRVDTVHISDAAEAHVLAVEKLTADSPWRERVTSSPRAAPAHSRPPSAVCSPTTTSPRRSSASRPWPHAPPPHSSKPRPGRHEAAAPS